MRGNNKRKLIPEPLLHAIYMDYNVGVPITKLIVKYQVDISRPHLRKLLLIYIDIRNIELNTDTRRCLYKAIFPPWLKFKLDITVQPDTWTYKGRFPVGEWEKKNV